MNADSVRSVVHLCPTCGELWQCRTQRDGGTCDTCPDTCAPCAGEEPWR